LQLRLPYTSEVKNTGLPSSNIRIVDEKNDTTEDFIVTGYSLSRARYPMLQISATRLELDLLRRTALFIKGKPQASFKVGYALPHLESSITLSELLELIVQPAASQYGFSLELSDEAQNDKRMLDIALGPTDVLSALRQALQRWSNTEKRYYATVSSDRVITVRCKSFPDTNDPTSGLRLVYPDRMIEAITLDNIDYSAVVNVIIPLGTERYADYRGLLLGEVESGPTQDANGQWLTPPSNWFKPNSITTPAENMCRILNVGDELMIVEYAARDIDIIAAGSDWIQVSPPSDTRLPIGYQNSLLVITSGPATGTTKLIVNFDERSKTIYVDSSFELDDPPGALIGEKCDVLISPLFATVIGGDVRRFVCDHGAVPGSDGDYWGGKDRLLVDPYTWVHYGEDGSDPPDQRMMNGLLILDTPSNDLTYAPGTSRKILIDRYDTSGSIDHMVVTLDKGFSESQNGHSDAFESRFIAIAPINTYWDFSPDKYWITLNDLTLTITPKSGEEMPFGNITPSITDSDFCYDAQLTVIDGTNEGQNVAVNSVQFGGASAYNLTINLASSITLAGDETLRLTFRNPDNRIWFQPRVEGPTQLVTGQPDPGDKVYLLSAYQSDGVPLTLGKLLITEEDGVRKAYRFPVYWASKRRIAVRYNFDYMNYNYPELAVQPGTLLFIGAYDVGDRYRIGFNLIKQSFYTLGQVVRVISVQSPSELGTDYWLLEVDQDLDPIPIRGVWCEVLSLQDDESIATYGRRERIVEFRDIISPVLLKTEAMRYLDAFKEPAARYRVKIHDLKQLEGVTIGDYDLDIGKTIALKDTLLGIDRNDLLITSIQCDLLNPWRIELAVETPSLYLRQPTPVEHAIKEIRRVIDQFKPPVKELPRPKESRPQIKSGRTTRKPHDKPEVDVIMFTRSGRVFIEDVCNPLYDSEGNRLTSNDYLGTAYPETMPDQYFFVDTRYCKIDLADLPDNLVDRLTVDMISLNVYVAFTGDYISQYAGYSPPGLATEHLAGIYAIVFEDDQMVNGELANYVDEVVEVGNTATGDVTLRVERGKGFIIGVYVPLWDYANDPDNQPHFNILVYWTINVPGWVIRG